MYGEHDRFFSEMLARQQGDDTEDQIDPFSEPPLTAGELRRSLVLVFVFAVLMLGWIVITG